jgi:hypothetical protein
MEKQQAFTKRSKVPGKGNLNSAKCHKKDSTAEFFQRTWREKPLSGLADGLPILSSTKSDPEEFIYA